MAGIAPQHSHHATSDIKFRLVGSEAEGIAIDDRLWQQIAALAGELEIELP